MKKLSATSEHASFHYRSRSTTARSSGRQRMYTGWGEHTKERIDEAWATLEKDTVDIEPRPPVTCGCRAIRAQLSSPAIYMLIDNISSVCCCFRVRVD